MPGSVRYVPHGASAFDALCQAIGERQAADPFASVSVIVPSRRAGVTLRHRLAKTTRAGGSKGAVNVRLVTLSDVAEDLGGVGCRRGGRLKATRSSIGAAARAALGSNPGFLAEVADDPSTEEEVVAFYEDLRQLGEDAFDLLRGRGRRGIDLATICQEMRAHLAPSCFDDADLVEAAIAALDETGSTEEFGPYLIVQLPERARPAERRLIAALAQHSDLVVHLGVLGDPTADAPILSIGEALVAEGLAGGSVVGSREDDCLRPDEPVTTGERIEARDAESEVRAAVRVVLDSLERGIPAERIAVLYSSRSKYHQLVAGVLDSAGVIWSGPSARRVIETATACTLTGLVNLAISGLERDAVSAWLHSAPLRDASGELLPVGAFELVSRRAGIVGGDAAEWRRHLDDLAAELRRGHEADDSEGLDSLPPSERSRRVRRLSGLDACRRLVNFINDLEARIRDLHNARTWSSLVKACRSALDSYLGGSAERASSPSSSVADAIVDQVLGEIEMLDEVGDRADLATFARALDGALERAFAYEGTLAKGIVVDDLANGTGLDLDVAIVLGAVEGELPGRVRSSPLLSASDRDAIGLEASTAKAVVELDRRRLLGAMCETGRFVLCLRERDAADGRARVRSRFVGDAVSVKVAPSAVGAIPLVSTGREAAIDRDELVVATLAALRGTTGGPRKSYLAQDRRLSASIAVHASRRARAFDRFSGHLPDGLALVETVRAGLSPTTLEAYAECPFRYFLSRELSLEVIEAPERRLTIDARDRGSIAHAVLERFVEEIISAAGALSDEGAGSKERLEEIADDVFARYERLGLTGARSLWRRERRKLLRVLNEERERDELRRRADHSIPVAVEWVFGGESDSSVSIDLGQRQLVFRGKVDRIDRRADGSFAVIDYKTGSSRRYTGLLEDPVDRGRHLQLVVYALAARAGIAMGDPLVAIRAAYRFIEEGQDIPVDFAEGTVERAREVLDVIVDGIESGRFPFNPGPRNQYTFDNCRFCDFDRLCPSDRDAFWESARTNEELSRFVSLVEPEEIDA